MSVIEGDASAAYYSADACLHLTSSSLLRALRLAQAPSITEAYAHSDQPCVGEGSFAPLDYATHSL